MLSTSEIAVRISLVVGTPAEGTLIRSVYFCSQAETDREKEVNKGTGRDAHRETWTGAGTKVQVLRQVQRQSRLGLETQLQLTLCASTLVGICGGMCIDVQE